MSIASWRLNNHTGHIRLPIYHAVYVSGAIPNGIVAIFQYVPARNSDGVK